MTTTCLVQNLLLVQRLTPGRRHVALVRMADRAREMPVAAPLLPVLDSAIRAQNETLVLVRRWQAAEGDRAIHGDGAQQVDVEVDNALAGFHATLEGMARSFAPPKAAMARRILDVMLPKGLGAVTNLPYVDQHAAIRTLVAELKHEPFADLVAALKLEEWVARIEELDTVYGEVVTRPQRLTFSEVRKSDTGSYVAMLEVVTRVLGLFPTNDPGDVDDRTSLLQPILDQEAELTALRARRKVTGEPLDPADEEIPAEDPQQVEPPAEPTADPPSEPPAG